MDGILLRLVEARPEQAPRVFATLFARCPPDALVRLLNDAGSPADFLAVSAAIPWAPTLGAAGRMAVGQMRWAASG